MNEYPSSKNILCSLLCLSVTLWFKTMLIAAPRGLWLTGVK